jgi:hypothetical protein
MYLIVWSFHSGIEGWDWMWILLGLFLDLSKWFGMWGNRREAAVQAQRYYPSGAPRYGGMGGNHAAVTGGQVPLSTSPTADDSAADPMAATTPPDIPKGDRPGG